MISNFSNFNKAISIFKNRLILFGLIFTPAFVCAQEAVKNETKATASSPDVKFYSKAKMYVGNTTSETGATMYIEGSAKFANNSSTDTGSSQIVQVGVTKLSGDFVDAFTTKIDNRPDTLFAAGSFVNNQPLGTIWFAGTDKVQKIYRESDVYDKAFGYNYINFPNLRVNQTIGDNTDIIKSGYVSVDTSAVISVANLEIGNVDASTAYKGGFAVEASYVGNSLTGATPNTIRSAYALVKNINNGNFAGSDGWCRVNFNIWDKNDPNTNSYMHTIAAETVPSNAKLLTPFSSPFQQLPLDYALWQVVLKPNGSALGGGGPIFDADKNMTAGEGYLLAQEVSERGYEDVNQWVAGTNSDDRFKGGYEFSRKIIDTYSAKAAGNMGAGFSKFKVTDYAEYFNTKDVEVTLKKGFTFVGNPYLVPLPMETFINRNGEFADELEPSNITTITGVNENNRVDYLYHRSNFAYYSDTNEDLYVTRKLARPEVGGQRVERAILARYDIVKQGYIYEVDLSGSFWGSRLRMGVDYRTSMYQGSTSYLEVPEELIPPMGVFTLYRPELESVENEVKIKIRRPDNLNYLSKRPISVTKRASSSVNTKSKELLIQALTGDDMYDDRHCLVFRDMAIDEDAGQPVAKGISGVVDSAYAMPVGTIYTKALRIDTTGRRAPRHVNFVPKTIKQMALYVVPPTTGKAKDITLKGYRMESIQDDIKSVWVEDRLDGSIRELTKEGLDYTLPVATLVPGSELDYRFILHFSETYDLEITDPTKPIDPIDPNGDGNLTVYYRNSDSRLTIENLLKIDTNSKVDVFDLQGRLITRFIISADAASVGIVERPLNLAQGTYIVRIIGERNHTSKFLSLQN